MAVALALAASLVLPSSMHAGQAQPPQAAAAASAPTATAEYAGSEACQACHEDIYKAFQKNPHVSVETSKRRGWEGKACESCHGPGAKHAESAEPSAIVNPGKLAARDNEKTCLACHKNQQTMTGRVFHSHARSQVSCSSCHSVHNSYAPGLNSATPASFVTGKPRTAGPRTRHLQPADVNALCAKCHADAWASFQRPHHHPLPENAMSCVDCHNPHGSYQKASQQVFSGNEPGCLRCHADKRGPFAFEHAPVRYEGCATCHQPHGSANPRMLTRAEVRFQCLECHSNISSPRVPNTGTVGGIPPALHDLRSPRYQNCTICHVKIHGSHVNRALLR